MRERELKKAPLTVTPIGYKTMKKVYLKFGEKLHDECV